MYTFTAVPLNKRFSVRWNSENVIRESLLDGRRFKGEILVEVDTQLLIISFRNSEKAIFSCVSANGDFYWVWPYFSTLKVIGFQMTSNILMYLQIVCLKF